MEEGCNPWPAVRTVLCLYIDTVQCLPLPCVSVKRPTTYVEPPHPTLSAACCVRALGSLHRPINTQPPGPGTNLGPHISARSVRHPSCFGATVLCMYCA